MTTIMVMKPDPEAARPRPTRCLEPAPAALGTWMCELLVVPGRRGGAGSPCRFFSRGGQTAEDRHFAGTNDQPPARLDCSLGVDRLNGGVPKLFRPIHLVTVARGTSVSRDLRCAVRARGANIRNRRRTTICRILEPTRLVATSDCNTLVQKMHTVLARPQGDPHTDSQEFPPLDDGKISPRDRRCCKFRVGKRGSSTSNVTQSSAPGSRLRWLYRKIRLEPCFSRVGERVTPTTPRPRGPGVFSMPRIRGTNRVSKPPQRQSTGCWQ